MARKKPKPVPYRRKREKKTDYQKRLKSLLAGKLRLVVRFTNQKVIAQLIDFTPTGDKVLLGINSFALKKKGWKYSCKNFPAAYLTGLLFGKKAVHEGYQEAILDTGFKSPPKKGKVYAFLRGVLDAGLNVPHGSEDIFPPKEVVEGKSIEDYALQLEKGKEVWPFSGYLKNKIQPENITKEFAKIKQELSG